MQPDPHTANDARTRRSASSRRGPPRGHSAAARRCRVRLSRRHHSPRPRLSRHRLRLLNPCRNLSPSLPRRLHNRHPSRKRPSAWARRGGCSAWKLSGAAGATQAEGRRKGGAPARRGSGRRTGARAAQTRYAASSRRLSLQPSRAMPAPPQPLPPQVPPPAPPEAPFAPVPPLPEPTPPVASPPLPPEAPAPLAPIGRGTTPPQRSSGSARKSMRSAARRSGSEPKPTSGP